jgi:hypothetical protein
MKMRKVTSSILLAVLLATGALSAQPSRPAGPPDSVRADQMLAEIREKVRLTDVQSPKVRAILMETMTEVPRDPSTARVDREAARGRMRAGDERIRALLTPEQIPLYEQYRTERREMMRRRMREMREKPQ